MNEETILSILEQIQKDVVSIKETVTQCPKRKIPFPADYRPVRRKACFSQRLRGGLRDPEIRAAIIRLRKEGQPYDAITTYIREHWPGQPEKHPSSSSVHRFFQSAMLGRLREFGIEPPVDL